MSGLMHGTSARHIVESTRKSRSPGRRRRGGGGVPVTIEFPSGISQGELPPLWVIGAEGDGQLVNYRVKGNHMIVDRLFGAAELKLGGKHQQTVRIVRTDGRPQS